VRFEELVADGAAAPVEGWDFSWFDGRAAEERPPWGYARLLGERMARATAALDVETGGGEVLGEVASPPPGAPGGDRVVAAQRRPGAPASRGAGRTGRGRGGRAVAPVRLLVLRPGGQPPSGHGAVGRDRTRAAASRHIPVPADRPADQPRADRVFVGPTPPSSPRGRQKPRAAAASAGLELLDLREAALRVEFFDVGAVVHFLRKVPWTVPDSVSRPTTASCARCTSTSSERARSSRRPAGCRSRARRVG
jgi:hypothetical protein